MRTVLIPLRGNSPVTAAQDEKNQGEKKGDKTKTEIK